jgi:hypothetical protein
VTPGALILSAILLGMFVLLAGFFGVLYGLGILRETNSLLTAAYGCWVLQLLVTILIIVVTPLGSGWKLLIAASCLAYLSIPHLTWRYLERLHQSNGGRRPTIS